MSDRPVEVMARGMEAADSWSTFWSDDDAQKLCQAALAALEQAGYVVVPKEPTEEMICNGDTEILAALNDHSGVRRNPTPAHSAYRAMLSTLSVGEGK